MTEAQNTKLTNLFRSLQLIRLNYDLQFVNEELNRNRSIPIKANDGFFKRTITALNNGAKDHKTSNLEKLKGVIQNERNAFLSANKNVEIYSENDIPSVIAEAFADDRYSLEKVMFSISLIFDTDYKYSYDTLSHISALIWRKEDRLANIKSGVEGYYKELAAQPLNTEQKFILGGVAALSFFTVIAPTLAVGGLSAAGISSTLAGLGGTMVGGIGAIAIAEFLLDGAIIGFTYALLDHHNKHKVKQSFREMSYDHSAKLLAIKLYIMHVAKQTMPKEMFKEKFSELLEMISDLKSDTDYVLLVEGENVAENKKKINVFHNLDNKLGKMFCV